MRKRIAGCPTWFLASVFVLLVFNLAPVPAEQNTNAPPITELILERTPCFGTCPVYKATIRSDGSLVYTGELYVAHPGTFTCEGNAYTKRQFQRLAELATQIHFDKFKPSYGDAAFDVPYTKASLLKGEESRTVVSCCSGEPTSLWGYEMAFDAVLESAWKDLKWKPVNKKKP